MGLFKGNKNKDAAEADAAKQSTQRRSRRIVVPGQKDAAAPASSGTSRVQQVNNRTAPAAAPSTQRTPARPGTQATTNPSGGETGRMVKPPAAKAPSADGLMLGDQTGSNVTLPSERPKSREPIRDSQPLAFAGDLSTGADAGPARTGDKALLEFLVSKANLIPQATADQAQQKARADGVAIDVALVSLDAVSEDQLVSALTQECWVPHLRVDKYEIRKKALDTIAREDAVRYSVFPVDKLGSLLTLAMVNPLDTETIRVLEGKTGLDIKKVVATRSEIAQGIEKYYSGQVEAKDTSISFTQDIEPKSVTQMLRNVTVRDDLAAPEPDLLMDADPMIAAAPKKKAGDSDIIPEIQDIDDLLSSDEIIAPAIIEPIGIEPISDDDLEPAAIPEGEIEPLGIRPQAEAADEFDDIGITAPAASVSDGIDIGDLDLSLDDTEQIEPLAPAAKASMPLAPEFADETPALKPPMVRSVAKAPAAKAPVATPPVTRSIPVAPPKPLALDEMRPVAPAAKAAAPAALPPLSAPARPAVPKAKATAPAAGRTSAPRPAAQMINLLPVMEEEFQHAITHGKAHLFERWVGLQTRNRIINGIQVEAELDDLLAGLYAAPRRVG